MKSLCKGFSDFKLKEGLLYLLGDEDCQLEVRKSSEHVRLRRMPWTHLGLHIAPASHRPGPQVDDSKFVLAELDSAVAIPLFPQLVRCPCVAQVSLERVQVVANDAQDP